LRHLLALTVELQLFPRVDRLPDHRAEGRHSNENNMGTVEGRASLLRQLVDERRLLARVLFWSFVLAAWSVLHSRRFLKGLRARYGS
jgi:hypothetical protein